jgi:hypothetical protein
MESKFVLAFLCFSAVVGMSSATIKCYSGEFVEGIADTGLTEVSDCEVCQKTRVHVSLLGVSSTSLTSSCQQSCTEQHFSVPGGSSNVYCCNTDLCNHAGRSAFAVSVVGILASVVLALLLQTNVLL